MERFDQRREDRTEVCCPPVRLVMHQQATKSQPLDADVLDLSPSGASLAFNGNLNLVAGQSGQFVTALPDREDKNLVFEIRWVDRSPLMTRIGVSLTSPVFVPRSLNGNVVNPNFVDKDGKSLGIAIDSPAFQVCLLYTSPSPRD